MATYPFQIVDVFAETQLAGNQLAIVHDAADLTTEQMQAIALETNYSETTFVTARSEGRASVRIFTPAFELPFAGHPTVGTAWALTGGQGSVTLDLNIGPVEVCFIDGIGWMTTPPVSFDGYVPQADAAKLIGLDSADIATDLPVELASVGPKFVLIPARNLAALRRAKLDGELHARMLSDGLPVQCVFVFTAESYAEDADYACRMFFESAGVREDPATGSANAAFAAYLRKHLGDVGDVVVDQGVEMNRPSRLYLKVNDVLQVGGRVQRVVDGELHV